MLCLAALAIVTSHVAAAAGAPLRWEQWRSLPGVVDVGGPLSTGELVVAAGSHLFRLARDGTDSELAPAYARAPFTPPAGSEPYIAVASPEVAATACPFPRDSVFALRPAAPGSVVRIDPSGTVTTFARLPDAGGLNGIVFDTVGRFGHRLIVTGGVSGGHVAVVAIDCHGTATTLTRTAPQQEGGLAVAPTSFPRYGGDLIGPDELSGRVVATDPSGASAVIAESRAPAGGDTGVEAVAFVPPGFLAGGAAYAADRGTAGSPHPGTDTLLRLSAAALAGAGVHEGDMLLTTEASDRIVEIRCATDCAARTLGMGDPAAHGEGHLLMVADHPRPPPPAAVPITLGGDRNWVVVTIVVAAVAAGIGAASLALVRRRRREARR